jgi:hypothetical protein
MYCINDFLNNIDKILNNDLQLPWCKDECKYPVYLLNDAIKSIGRQQRTVEHVSKSSPEPSEQRVLNFRIMYNQNHFDPYPFVDKQLRRALGEKRAEKFVSRKVNLFPSNLKRLLISSRFYYNSEPPFKLPSPCQLASRLSNL